MFTWTVGTSYTRPYKKSVNMAMALPEVELPEVEFACLREHDVYCKGCRELYRNPVTLPCLHVLCSKCSDKGLTQEKGEGDEVIKKVCCEYCKAVSTLEAERTVSPAGYQTTLIEVHWVLGRDLTKQRCQESGPDPYVLRKLEKMNLDKEDTAEATPAEDKEEKSDEESSVQTHGPTTVYCLDCSRFLCDACCSNHDETHASKLHLDQEQDYESIRVACSGRQARCEHHPSRIGPYCCIDCTLAICDECRQTKHSTHEYDKMEVVAARSKKQLIKITETVDFYIKQVQDAMKETDRQKEKADRDIAMMRQMVHEHTEEVLERVREQEAAIMAQLDLKEQAILFTNQDKSGRKP